MNRTLSTLFALLSLGAAAQGNDEWTSPFAGQPATAPAEPVKPAAESVKPAEQPRPSAPTRPTDPNARARAEQKLKAAEGQAAPVADAGVGFDKSGLDGGFDQLPIIARVERVVPGTEEHSPATYNLGVTDPGTGRVTVGSVGVGLLHVQSARLGPKGVLRFSVLGEYSHLNDFPVLTAENIRSAGTFAVSWVPFSFGEAYFGYQAAANTNNRTSPNLIQALGDLTIGIKVAYSFVKGLHTGLDLRLLTFSAVGNQSIDRFAVGFNPRLLVTYDFRSLSPRAVFLLHLNLGFTFDSTSGLVTSQTLSASEEYALNVNKYNRFNFSLGLEVPLPVVSPFLEYKVDPPLGVPAAGLVGPNGQPVDAAAAMAQRFGVGLKVTAIKDLTVLAAFDIGLARSVAMGIPATAPWNFLFGASFNIDPFQRGETKIVETVRERTVEKKVAEAPRTGKVEGVVLDSKTCAPIAGVLISSVGLGQSPVATEPEAGRFVTYELPVGPVKLKASRDGYKDLEQEFKIDTGKSTKGELLMEAELKKATFAVTVTTGGKKKSIAAVVVFRGPVDQSAGTNADVKDPVKVDIAAGTYTVSVTADGYLAQTRDVQIAPGAEMAVAFDLSPAPKKSLVIFKDDKIEILQQVHFEFGKARILADSNALLNQVVDAIVKNGVKRVRVEGHTDNKGAKDANQKLSDDRAAAIVDYLVGQGIDRSRLEAAGFGDTRPVAPNLTARGRELNRRVEFIVLEK